MQILHCGGEANHRESTPYISCSQDLLWCLLSSAIALLRGTASNVQIWFIDNTRTHHDLQYNVWQEEHWDKLSNNVQNPDIDIAKERAVSSSEVLVYKEISRERILGVLNLDLEKIQRAPAEFGSWAQETLEKMWSYPFAVCKYFLEHPDDWDDLVDWCEYQYRENSLCRRYIHSLCGPCSIQGFASIVEGSYFHWSSYDSNEIRVAPNVHWGLPMGVDILGWRVSEWASSRHKRWIDLHNEHIIFQEDEQQEIIEELMLDAKMEGLGLDNRKWERWLILKINSRNWISVN